MALGISTFFQQALNYDTIYPHAIDAYMPVAQYMNGSGTAPVGDDTTMYGIDTQLLSSPYVALYSPSKTEFTATAIAHCGTGNCTWESYQTLGICNTCANLTSKLEMTKVHIVPDNNSTLAYDTNYYTLPNGFGLTGIQPGEGYSQLNFWDVSTAILNITTTLTHAWDSIAFANNGSKLFSVFAVGASPGTIPAQIDETYSTESMNGSSFAPPIAFECLLQFCIRNMTAEFTHGTLFESEQSSWTDQSQPVVDAKNPDADITLQPPDSSTSFLATGTAIHGTGQWLSRLVAGNVTNKPLISDPSNEWQLQAADYSSDLMQAFYMEMNSSSTGFPDLMDNLANSLSLNLRQISYQPSVKGNAFSSTSHAVVTWEWLILPLIELVASLVFLIAVMVETSKNGLLPWTNNVLALFFHGLDERPLGRRVRESGDHMRDKAREVMMEFDRHKNGGRLFITES